MFDLQKMAMIHHYEEKRKKAIASKKKQMEIADEEWLNEDNPRAFSLLLIVVCFVCVVWCLFVVWGLK